MGKKATVSLKKTKHNNKNKPPTQQDNRMQLLQMALAEAIEQNQELRKRVCELEALLVAAQMRCQEIAEKEERKEGREGEQPQKNKTKRWRMSKL